MATIRTPTGPSARRVSSCPLLSLNRPLFIDLYMVRPNSGSRFSNLDQRGHMASRIDLTEELQTYESG